MRKMMTPVTEPAISAFFFFIVGEIGGRATADVVYVGDGVKDDAFKGGGDAVEVETKPGLAVSVENELVG
jgi:hypothetical protein